MNILDYIDIYHSTTKDGNMSYKYGLDDEVKSNREKFFKRIGLDYSKNYLIGINDEKMNKYMIVEKTPQQFTTVEGVDALITNNRDISLSLLTADCLQIVLYDPRSKLLALLHCGRLQLEAGIIDKVLNGIGNNEILVYLGSCISTKNYKWDKNILKNLNENSYLRKNIIEEKDGLYRVDLRSAVKDNITSLGVDMRNIYDSNIDTYNKKCFSHVRSIDKNEPEGRHLTVVKIK